MPLPTVVLPTSSVEVNGSSVPFRSLSRAEALRITDFQGHESDAEVFILACATDSTEDDVRVWLAGTTFEEAGKLTDAVLTFSGLAATKAEAPDPKRPMNGRSSKAQATLTPSS